MSIIPKLASSLNRRDEVLNQELAKQIADEEDKNAVQELIDNLSNKRKDIQNDCIKVLYEICEITPSLIVSHTNEFLVLLDHKNNRLQWGAMTALNNITLENPKAVYASLAKIVAVADAGSVITKDHAVNILIKLCSVSQYAEKAIPIITDKNKGLFIKTLTLRLDDIEKETKRKRVEKVIKKFSDK